MVSKAIILLCCIVASVLAVERYTDKFDNFDWNEVVKNKRLLVAYCNCILDKGQCTPEGKTFKDNIQDALETGCEKCNEVQQNGVTTVVDHMVTNELELWKEITDKYDPKGIWRKKYEDKARERGIVIPKD